ncbi:hypothetical protein C8R47DRAFT_1322844 [Mycena vitilis]|nr:hypothetical protein C8R47DRAFT_1322844 [Mycena vitilis]
MPGRWQTVFLGTPPKSMILRFNNLNEAGCFPHLRASIDRVELHGSPRRLDVPFGQLTQLRVQMPSTSDRCLRIAQDLVQLTLGKAAHLPPPLLSHTLHAIELPRLRMLSIVLNGFDLNSFILPALEDINVEYNTRFLPDLTDRSSCRLYKLAINEAVGNISLILDRVPSIVEICVHRLYMLSVLVHPGR